MKKKILLSIMVLTLCVGVGAYMKSEAAGWLWGGSEDANIGGLLGSVDGNETNLGWIAISDQNTADAINYGLTIPSGTGLITGYAATEWLGYIDFEPQTHCTTLAPGAGQYQALSCTPPAGCVAGVTRNVDGATSTGDTLTGCARVVDIAKATVTNNSGGWEGWIKMSGANYGVTLDDSGNGKFCDPDSLTTTNKPCDNSTVQCKCFAWNGETAGAGSNMANGLGWVDFSPASIPVANVIRICGDCTGVAPLTDITIIGIGNTFNAKACLVSSAVATCAGSDVTDSTGWTSSDVAIATVSSGVSPRGVVTGVSLAGTNINAQYIDGSDTLNASVPVTISAPAVNCGNGFLDAGEQCDTAADVGSCTAAECTASCTCPSSGGTNWIEVTP